MLGLSPDQMGHLFFAAYTGVLLVLSAAHLRLHKHRYTIRGLIRKLLHYL